MTVVEVDQGRDRLGSERLIGRARELERARDALEDKGAVGLLFIHGPGGIGKTALVSALAAEEAERRLALHVDARDLAPSPEAFGEALAGVGEEERPLILIDSFELIESSAAYLRDAVVPTLPVGATLIVVGRNPPRREWFEGPWGAQVREVRLGPLADQDAYELVTSYGVGGDAADRIVAWGHGHPLALDLGSRLALDRVDWSPGEGMAPEELVRALVRRLGEGDVGAGHLPTLGVAAIARSTTPALLEAVLPEHDARVEWEWLAGRSFVESVGEGVALHALLRDAVRADLNRRDPLLESSLKRRIADHVYEIAESTGELGRVVDLSHLIDDPGLRWGFLWEASARYYLDSPRPGDAVEIDRILSEPGVEPIWSGTAMWVINREFLERMPELGAVVKDPSGKVAGFTFVPTTAVDDPTLERAPVIGPILAHARTLEPRGEALIMTDMCDLTGDPANGMVGMLANAALLRASRSNPRYAYMTIDEEIELGQAFAKIAGAVRVPELDAQPGRERLLCWLIDFGPGGFLANQRELVYRELNLDPPPRPAERVASVYAERVRDALRNLDNPTALAESPLARGEDVSERAESVRSLIAEATAQAFGDQPDERLLREVIVRGYLDRAPSHEVVASELYLSRSAYFRRLRQAVDRVGQYVSRRG